MKLLTCMDMLWIDQCKGLHSNWRIMTATEGGLAVD